VLGHVHFLLQAKHSMLCFMTDPYLSDTATIVARVAVPYLCRHVTEKARQPATHSVPCATHMPQGQMKLSPCTLGRIFTGSIKQV
jgi:hypothetical protein